MCSPRRKLLDKRNLDVMSLGVFLASHTFFDFFSSLDHRQHEESCLQHLDRHIASEDSIQHLAQGGVL